MDYDKYKTKLDWPTRPKAPAVLDKKASSLTADELATLAQVKADYDAAVVQHTADVKAYREDQAKLENDFRRDLIAEFGMTGHPMADKVYGKAWEHGHSSGLSSVYFWFDEFMEVVTK